MPKPLEVYSSPDLLVTFDPNICTALGDCLRALPAVFDRSRPAWVELSAAAAPDIAEVAARCPSGALQARRAGVAPSAPLPSAGVSLAATRNGPLVVKGPVALELPTGATEKRTGTFALCRCGQTQRTPFCDGSHIRTGFRSPA
jgi:uncharacterized Fe-S cluster protein YjdI